MGDKSKIEWTDATWNPVTGCSKVSPGCKHCYAEVMAGRLKAMGQPRYRDGFKVTLQHDLLDLPLRWRKPRRIFVNSMSDLFHDDVPDAYIADVFETMRRADWHTFQVLTKRSARLRTLAPSLPWPDNVWMGVSAEDQRRADERIPHLLTVPARVRFISAEPLLGAVDITDLACGGNALAGCEASWDGETRNVRPPISWVIVGGESGPGARPMDLEWARSLRDQCQSAAAPFFMKQMSAHAGADKKAIPDDLRIREVPNA